MPFREGSSQPQVGLLSTPTVSSVAGEYNYFSAVAKVIITAGASQLLLYSYNAPEALGRIWEFTEAICTPSLHHK